VASRLRAAVLAALFTALLCACAAVPRGREISAVDPAALTSFELNGRINLKVHKEAFPGRVRWQHAPAMDELWFYSPVGSAVAHLRQDGDGAWLMTAEGREYRADDLRRLAFEVLGWDLPLEALPYWVRGIPWPQADARDAQRDGQGRLKRLEQGGWQVTYLAWGASGLPAKLDLLGERLRMRLLVERWSRHAAGG
jgi:outer membrane lipoprotein LolB